MQELGGRAKAMVVTESRAGQSNTDRLLKITQRRKVIRIFVLWWRFLARLRWRIKNIQKQG